VLSEYCGGSNLGDCVKTGQPVAMEKLRHYAQGMVSGLGYLHRHDVVHKLFRVSMLHTIYATRVNWDQKHFFLF
jgi:hypothetical protein